MTESDSQNPSPVPSGEPVAPTRRVFFALPINDSCRQALADLSARMQKAAHFMPLRVSWVPPVNFHLTLHFLGSVPVPTVQNLITELPGAVAGVHHFELDIRHLGYFPNARQPRVLWAGIHQPPAGLKHLHDVLADLIRAQGLEIPHDNFHAHLTLARFKGLKGTGMFVKQVQNMQYVQVGKSSVAEVHLMESQLDPSGPVYTVLGRGALARD